MAQQNANHQQIPSDFRIPVNMAMNPNAIHVGVPPPPQSSALSVAPLPNHSGSSHSSSSSTSSANDLTGMNNPKTRADLSRLSHAELIQRVRKLESDLIKLASDHNHMIREANHRIQVSCNAMR